ncbi:MAG: hypothetical protein ABIH69_06970, partial [bacterium]
MTNLFQKARLSLAATLGMDFATRQSSLRRCGALFKKERVLPIALAGWVRRGFTPENLGPLLRRQSSRIEQGLVELVVNSIEAVTGNKIIGRFGEGRLQNLARIIGKPSASFEVITKHESDMGRRLFFRGIKALDHDVEIELDNSVRKETGTTIRLKTKLNETEQRTLNEYLRLKLRYARGVAIVVNGQRINEAIETEETQKIITINISRDGYSVEDNGSGMTAETLVKRFLAIGNSEGEH